MMPEKAPFSCWYMIFIFFFHSRRLRFNIIWKFAGVPLFLLHSSKNWGNPPREGSRQGGSGWGKKVLARPPHFSPPQLSRCNCGLSQAGTAWMKWQWFDPMHLNASFGTRFRRTATAKKILIGKFCVSKMATQSLFQPTCGHTLWALSFSVSNGMTNKQQNHQTKCSFRAAPFLIPVFAWSALRTRS